MERWSAEMTTDIDNLRVLFHRNFLVYLLSFQLTYGCSMNQHHTMGCLKLPRFTWLVPRKEKNTGGKRKRENLGISDQGREGRTTLRQAEKTNEWKKEEGTKKWLSTFQSVTSSSLRKMSNNSVRTEGKGRHMALCLWSEIHVHAQCESWVFLEKQRS